MRCPAQRCGCMQISAKADFGGSAPPQNAASLVKWAEVLLRPELNRIEEACELLQQAAAGMAAAGERSSALSGGPDVCCTLAQLRLWYCPGKLSWSHFAHTRLALPLVCSLKVLLAPLCLQTGCLRCAPSLVF